MTWTLADSGGGFTATGGAGFVFTYPGAAPVAGDHLSLWISSNTTVSTPAGWTLSASDVATIGAYSFFKIAGASEPTSVTITTSGNFPTAIGYLRHSGASATPLDVAAVGRSTVNGNATPPATTAALAGAGELSIAVACLAGLQSVVQSSPVWSSGYTQKVTAVTAGTGVTDQRLFVGTNPNAGPAAESPSCSWTGNCNARTLLVVTFKPSASVFVPGTPMEVVGELNRLAKTIGRGEQAAANIYAGTTGLEAVGALNVKAGTTGLDMQGVCNKLAGTTGYGTVKALSLIATPP